jgi:polar amino acid transport system substrate-binding protein
VLLVEGHPINQKVVAHMLGRMGHSVAVASNGQQGVEMSLADHFDLILMDIQMPILDGFEALATIRSHVANGHPRVPIIALTAHAMTTDRERFLSAGFDGYLSKPVRFDELRQAVEERTAACSQPIDPSAEPRLQEHETPSSRFLANLSRECGYDQAWMSKLLDSYMETTPGSLQAIKTALATSDAPALASALHGLKGASQSIHADDLVTACQDLEASSRASDLHVAWEAFETLQLRWDQFRSLVETCKPGVRETFHDQTLDARMITRITS